MENCPFQGTCQGLKEICKANTEECKALRENDRVVMLEVGDLKGQIVEALQSTRSAHHRLDSMEKHTEAVVRLAVSVEGMSEKVERVLTLYDEHEDRLVVIENKPGQTAIKAWHWLLGALAGGCIGLGFGILLSKLGG